MSDVNPYAAPEDLSSAEESLTPSAEETVPEGMWRKGKLLIVRKDAVFPDRCVKTNQPAYGQRRKSKLTWTPPSIIFSLFLLAGIIIFLAFYLLGPATGFWSMIATFLLSFWICSLLGFRKKAIVEFALSDSARDKELKIALLFFSLLGLSFLFIATSLYYHTYDSSWGYLLFTLGITIAIAANTTAIILSVRCGVMVKRIDDEYIWLKGVHPDYLAMLPEWPGT